jgi:hypothetical protein
VALVHPHSDCPVSGHQVHHLPYKVGLTGRTRVDKDKVVIMKSGEAEVQGFLGSSWLSTQDGFASAGIAVVQLLGPREGITKNMIALSDEPDHLDLTSWIATFKCDSPSE